MINTKRNIKYLSLHTVSSYVWGSVKIIGMARKGFSLSFLKELSVVKRV